MFMSHGTQSAWRWVGLLIFGLCSVLLLGQDNTQNSQPAPSRTVRTPLQIMITGCLKKNAETGGYYVSDENGRTWELSSKKVDLAAQVFHTVSVSGHPMSGTTPPEGKNEQGQKAKGGSQQLSLDVVELTMISNSCTR
jgi:hypothetical protein